MSLTEVRKIAKGRIWSGKDALERGLVDSLGGLSHAISIAKQEAGLSQVTSSCSRHNDCLVASSNRRALAVTFEFAQ